MIQNAVKGTFDAVRSVKSEDILSPFGLSRKRSALEMMLPAAGLFVAGLIVGAGIGLLAAPQSGRETRRRLRGSVRQLGEHIDASDKELAQDVHQALAKPIAPKALDHASPPGNRPSNRPPLSPT